MKRRDVLASLAATGAVTTAGCVDAVSFLGAGIKLGRLSVVNWDEDESHTIDVRVKRDGDIVHASTHTVGEMEGNTAQATIADCSWDNVAGEYLVSARLAAEDDWQSFDLLDVAEQSPDCVIAAVQYGHLSGIDEQSPLNIEVRTRCDEISENYEGGCSAYKPGDSQ